MGIERGDMLYGYFYLLLFMIGRGLYFKKKK